MSFFNIVINIHKEYGGKPKWFLVYCPQIIKHFAYCMGGNEFLDVIIKYASVKSF